jgi:hypothetical protein
LNFRVLKKPRLENKNETQRNVINLHYVYFFAKIKGEAELDSVELYVFKTYKKEVSYWVKFNLDNCIFGSICCYFIFSKSV